MANLVIIGSQWGDEGKGKIVDILAKDADLVVRYQGAPMPAIPSSINGIRSFSI